MSNAQDVQFWAIRKRDGRRKPWEVRWRVDTGSFSRSFLTKALGETYRAKLVTAARQGERFSAVTGEPVAWAASSETLYAHAREFVKARWKDEAPNTRRIHAQALCQATLAHLDPRKARRGRPEEKLLRHALRMWAFNAGRWDQKTPDDVAAALAWVAAASRPVRDLADEETGREATEALLAGTVGLVNGGKASRGTIRKKRGVLHRCLEHAVDRKILKINPLTGLNYVQSRTAGDRAVDPRTVPSQQQAERLLSAVPAAGPRIGGRLKAFFACMYYAGMRPGEVRHLKADDLSLPETGWGEATLSGTTAEPGASWTDDGSSHDARELKHRSPRAVRVVPLPPVLVAMLRDHLATHGTAPDGRLFWTKGHRPVCEESIRRLWGRVRARVLTASELACGLARRPYDLRHGNASLLLAAGVSPAEVARRLGNSIRVLYEVYFHWLDGQTETGNALIDAAMTPKPMTRQNTTHGPDTGQHSGRRPKRAHNRRSKRLAHH